MRSGNMVLQALLGVVLVFGLLTPTVVAGASSAAVQPPDDRTDAHSAVGSFSHGDCLPTERSENCVMKSGLADSPWLEAQQNLQVGGRSPYTGRETSDETNEAATTTANSEELRTEGFWLDYITIQREPDRTTAVLQLQAGEHDLYAHTLDSEELFDIVNDDPNLWYKSSIGSFNTLRINPYGPEFTTGMVNPFYLFDFPEGVRTMNEVLNKFIDRDFIASDIMGGLAWPRYTSRHTQLSDYARYYDGTFIEAAKSISALEDEYAYDPVTGRAWLNATMGAIDDLAPGTITGNAAAGWRYNGDPIPVVVAIRSDDPIREEIGDYVIAALRDMGFDAVPFKGDMVATLTGLVNVDAEIRGGGWTVYTGGWVSMSSQDPDYWFLYFHTSFWAAGIRAFGHLDVPEEFWDAAMDLAFAGFTAFYERDSLYEICLPEHMKYGMFYLVDTRGFSPLRRSVNLAADRAGGIYGSRMWALTAHFRDTMGNPQFGGHMRVAMHDLLVEPWNPIAGSNTIYDMFPIRATGDMGTHPDTRDGLRQAGRLERAEVTVKQGLPAIATNPWVTLDFADTITAPSCAWRAWNWETQSAVTVADALANPGAEWGLDSASVNRYSVAYYSADIWDHPLHCGSTLSFADFLYGWILTYDRGQGEGVNPMFDAAAKAAVSSTYGNTIGIKFHVNPEPGVGLKVETWSQLWDFSAEFIVSDRYPDYAQGNGFWHTVALGIRGERAGEMAFSEVKAQPTTLGWINLLDRDVQQDALVGYLDGIRTVDPGDYEDAVVPYYAFIDAQYGAMGLGSFAAEVDLRMDNLEDFVGRVNHLWVGSGPYYLEDYSSELNWIRLAAFEDYPDPAERWLFMLDRHDLTASSTDGGLVTAPGEGTYTYPEGAVIDLVAEPDSGYRFVNWTGDVNKIVDVDAARTTVAVEGDYSITASFESVPPPIPWWWIAFGVVIAGLPIFLFLKRRRRT